MAKFRQDETRFDDTKTMSTAYARLRSQLDDAERQGLAFFAVFGCVDQTPAARMEFAHPRPERKRFFLEACAEAAEFTRRRLG